mgnify:CR=1 FL=1
MMIPREIISTKGDSDSTIDELMDFLKDAKEKGATHYKMTWSHDPMWAFKWFEAYRLISEEERRLEKIKKLEEQLGILRNDTN